MGEEDVIRKVRGLLRVAEDSAASEGERSNASALAEKLKTKHAITDDDLIEHEDVGGLFDGLFSSFRWSTTVRHEMDAVWGQVEALVERMARDEKGASRAEAVNMIYGIIRTKLGEDTKEPYKGTLKWRRDELLTDYYDAYLASLIKRDKEWKDDDEDAETKAHWREYRKENAREHVASRVSATGARLTKLTVEKSIARIHNHRGWEKRRAREKAVLGQPCHYCGQGEIEIEMSEPMKIKGGGYRTVTYMGKQKPHAMWDDDTVIAAHPSCWRKARA